MAGMFMEDVEVSSVDDVGSLANQLEAALKASGGTSDEELEMSEEEKKRIEEEADDGCDANNDAIRIKADKKN
ncbi:MAG: hypothetical protein SGBAC_002456 [Bacillariaceae sp.]